MIYQITILKIQIKQVPDVQKNIKGIFENLRIWGIHWTQYLKKIHFFTKFKWNLWFFWPNFAYIHNFVIWLGLSLLSTVLTFNQSFCLRREWVKDHQYFRRFSLNKRVLQIITFLDIHGRRTVPMEIVTGNVEGFILVLDTFKANSTVYGPFRGWIYSGP